MKLIHRVSFTLLAVTLTFAAFSVSAQKVRPDFNRPQTYDVQHYIIRVSFDRANKTVIGDSTVILKPLEPDLRSVELDAVGIKFNSVMLQPGDTALKYKAEGEKVIVALDKDYSQGDTVSINFKYTAKPNKGIYFVDATDRHSAQIWTQGEPDEARHWLPSFDFPSDRATAEQFITADKGETVVGNGELISTADAGNGKETWHYKMAVPFPVYLVSFVVGKYARVEDKFGTIPLGYYVYPGREATARKAFGRTADMIRQFELLTGVKFPYNKYDQTIVANFQFGGMENITATTMADTEIFMAETEFGQQLVMDLVSHELAHSWFGNLVTCRNWAELWLNEGFATFMEAAYREGVMGREGYIAKVRSDAAQYMIDDTITRRRHGLFNLRAKEVSALFDNSSVTYNKGGAVVHMLRAQVGDDKFWQAINTYLNRHKYGSVESTDLRKAMEETSGQDLGWFFDQWVYATGFPKLDVRQTWNPRSKMLRLTVTQTQKIDPLIPSAFKLPLEVEIESKGAVREEKLDIGKRVQTFSFILDSKPGEIRFDPMEKIVIKTIKARPMVTVLR